MIKMRGEKTDKRDEERCEKSINGEGGRWKLHRIRKGFKRSISSKQRRIGAARWSRWFKRVLRKGSE